jgi:hypothetical protein
LAAAETLPNGSYSTVGQTYSSGSGGKNVFVGASVTSVAVTPLCLTTVSKWGASCTSTSPNAIQVTETANVTAFFTGIFGMNNVTVNATSTAAGKGSVPLPYNVAIVLDSTLSMNTYDANCSATQMTCACSSTRLLTALRRSLPAA